MNEELMIKVKVDTSSISTSINKIKNEVSNVNKVMNSTTSATGLTKSTTAATAGTKKLTESMNQVREAVQGISAGMSGWDFVKAVTGIKAVQTVIENVLSKLDGKQGNFANAFASLIPSSSLYDDVPWEGWDAAWKNFNDNFIQGIGSWGDAAATKLLKVKDAINNIPTPKGLAQSLKNTAQSAKEVVSTKLWDFMFKTRLHFGVAEVSAKQFVKNGLEKIKNFKLPSLSKIGDSIKNLGGNIKNLVSGGLDKAASGLKGLGSGATASAGAVAAAGAALVGFIAILAAFTAAGVAAALSVSKLGKEISNSAKQFGFSTKAYQEWSYLMERTGSSVEDLKGFLETLNSEQGAVITGSEEAAQKFKNLGISAEEAASMDSQKLFETTITKLQGIEDAATKSAYAYEMFGDEASRLMNVINMSNGEMQEAISNYHLLGGSMSGELIDSSNSLQGSISAMKQAWQGISNTMAEVFIPVVQAVVKWLTKAFVWVNLFLRTIFGLDLKSSAASDSMDKNTSSTKKYTGGLKSATKAAEELKRTTMGFDELNIVSDPNKDSGSTGGAGSSAAAGLGNIPTLDDSMLNMDGLNLESMYAWFEEYKGVIAQITTWSLILIGVILAVIGICTVNIPMAILGIGMAGLGIAVGIKSGAFEEAGNAISKAFSGAIDAIGKGFKWLVETIGNFFKSIGEGIVNIGIKVVESVSSFIEGVKNVVKTIVNWVNEKIIQPIVKFVTGLVTAIITGVTNAINGIKNVFITIVSWINKNIIQPVGNFFSGMWNGFKDGASKAWNGIKSVFSVVTTWFKDKFSAAWNAVKNIFSTGGKIFDGIKDGIASTFKTVVNGIIGGINKVIKVPFDAINGMLNKIRGISVAGVEPFKDLWKKNPLSVPQIPKLATGGITTGATLAQIGEAGKEAVLPLENNTEWMDTLADKIAERNSSPTKVVLQIGEKELGWATINSINNITKQTGGIQLAL